VVEQAALIVAGAVDPARPRARYLPLIRAAECRHHLSQGLLASLIGAGSAYKVRARSRVGALGLTQLMPGTEREVGVTDRLDPARSIEGGARYLGRTIELHHRPASARRLQRAGPGTVTRAGYVGVASGSDTTGRSLPPLEGKNRK